MMVKKITLGAKIMDVIDEEEYLRRSELAEPLFDDTCIEKDGMVYPIQKRYDGSPGVYDAGPLFKYTQPVVDKEQYNAENIIDFGKAKTFGELLKTQDSYRKAEEALLTTKDNITICNIKSDDLPELILAKEMINAKNIDLDAYKPLFGADGNNAFRPVKDKKNTSISFYRLKNLCDVLGVRATLTLEDKPNAINPMGITLSAELTMGE